MSAPDNSCYSYVIGLYNGSCDCYAGKPVDFDVSDSGLYISDLLEPKFIDGLLNCDAGASIWTLMDEVRDLAIRYFIADGNALLLTTNKLKRAPYYGGLGLATYTRDMTIPDLNYAGVRIISPLIRSGYLKIKKIGLLLNSTEAITLTIYDRHGTLLHTLNLNSTANVHTVNDIADITLPLYDEYLDYIEYFFVYQVNGFQPKNNSLYACSSCQKNRPPWGNFPYNSKHPWANWVNAGGFNSIALPDFMNSTDSGSDYMNGLTFQIELGCLVNEVFCQDALDFSGNTLAQAMAVAIQMKAGALFIDKILNTTNLNRAVMLDREQQQKNKDEWLANYNEMLKYIAENIDITANDCFECRDLVDMIKAGIFA